MIRTSETPGRPRLRRGITLIEVLILITCVAVMLGLCAVTIQLMLRLFNDSQSRLSSSVMFERLGRQLRQDAHASESARILEAAAAPKSARRATLALGVEPGHEISYVVLEGAIARDETVGGKRVRHESYSLPRGREARFEMAEGRGRPVVSLFVTHGPGPSHAEPPRPLQVVAVVGKHRPGPNAKPEERKQ